MHSRSIAWLGLVAVCLALTGCDFGKLTSPDQSGVAFSTTDLTVGTGATAVTGTTATVSYTLWLYSDSGTDHKGNQIDASSFSFLLGGGQVIPGFEQGVNGMKVGGTRRAIVPPQLAYGVTGNGDTVPPNAALVFEIALTAVQ